VHGGYAAALLDSACGCAVHSFERSTGPIRAGAQIAYHRHASATTGSGARRGKVVSIASAWHSPKLGSPTPRALYASATSTLLVFERRADPKQTRTPILELTGLVAGVASAAAGADRTEVLVSAAEALAARIFGLVSVGPVHST